MDYRIMNLKTWLDGITTTFIVVGGILALVQLRLMHKQRARVVTMMLFYQAIPAICFHTASAKTRLSMTKPHRSEADAQMAVNDCTGSELYIPRQRSG
jgi:hypothetical protein